MKADDSSLDPEQRRAVEERARHLLSRADAWGVLPTPIPDLVAAAQLTVAPTSMFDPSRIMSYLRDKAVGTAIKLKSALSKVLGIYDGDERVIHIDDTVAASKQNFLTLHETGHHEMPAHRKMFRLFQDCNKTLSPDIADLFEREANNFARYALFQDDAYAIQAADHPMSIKTPMKLAKNFGASQYASAREFVRTHHRACVVYILDPIEMIEGVGARAMVRRVEASPSFVTMFGKPTDTVVTPDHFLGDVLPIGKRMTRPMALSMGDLNGVAHECVAEAFDTKWNVLILLYPVKALTATTVILPAGVGITLAD